MVDHVAQVDVDHVPERDDGEKPIPSSVAQSITEVASAPDCETNATFPSAGVVAAKLGVEAQTRDDQPEAGWGPRMPQAVETRGLLGDPPLELRPSSPASRNPADSTATPLTPASPQ